MRRRIGYTLLELVVVLGIIVLLVTLLVLAWTSLGSSVACQREAGNIAGMLGSAKMMALRDKRPTGVRLTSSNQLVYVQQPDDFTGGLPLGVRKETLNNKLNAWVVDFIDRDFTGGLDSQSDWPVQPGDWLEVNGGGPVHTIWSVSTNTLTFMSDPGPILITSKWRIIRRPKPKQGEPPLVLQSPIIVDASYCLDLPGCGSNGIGEIIFAPSGQVTNGLNSRQIVLWIRDGSLADPTQGEPMLIGVQVNTGLIGTYPVNLTKDGKGNFTDLYGNTRDPHASGM